MLLISEQEIQKRLRQVPEKLKTALNLPATLKVVDNICQANYLKKEWIEDVAMVTAEVLMGFLHPEDTAKELQEVIGLNYKIANSVSQDIEKRIFAPLKEEINNSYSPLPQPKEEIKEAPQEIKTSPPPIDLRFLNKEETTPPPASPQPTVPPSAPAPTPTPTKPTAGPAILFKSESSPIPPPTPTRKPSLGGLFGAFSRKGTEPTKEKIKVQIETSMPQPEEKSKVAKTEVPAFKVVHYTQFEPQAPNTSGNPKMIFGAQTPTAAKQIIPPPPVTMPITKQIPPVINIPKPIPPINKPILPTPLKPFAPSPIIDIIKPTEAPKPFNKPSEIQKPPMTPMSTIYTAPMPSAPPIQPTPLKQPTPPPTPTPISQTAPIPIKPKIQQSPIPTVQIKPSMSPAQLKPIAPPTPPAPTKPSTPPIQPIAPAPQKIYAKPAEGEEMIDLTTFEKVRIKPESENNQPKNNDTIDLRK